MKLKKNYTDYMNDDKIKTARILRDKAKEQLEGFEKLIISLSLQELDPNIFEDDKSVHVGIVSSNGGFSRGSISGRKMIDRLRGSCQIKLNESTFPAEDATDELWNHLVDEHLKKQ